MADACIAEIKAGGMEGIFGLDQFDWGGQAGAIHEVWKVTPCCGGGNDANGMPKPDPKQAIICCGMWWCCGLCSFTKLYSSAVDQPCSIVPHCLMGWCCAPCTRLFTRYSLRKKAGVKGNIIGDCVCLYFCGCCSFCQELRSVQPNDWNLFLPQMTIPQPVAPQPTKLWA